MTISLRAAWPVLVAYLRPQRRAVALLAALLFSGIALQLVVPQLMGAFIDAARAGSPLATLTQLALVFLGIALIKYLVTLAATYVSESVSWTATNALREDLAVHCLQLDMTFHAAHTPGEMIERVDGDVNTLASFFSQLVLQIAGNLLLLSGVLVVLWFVDWRLGAAFTVFSAVALVVLGSMRNIAAPNLMAARQASANLFGFIEERLNGTEDVRANGGGPYVMRKLFERMRQVWRTDFAAAMRISQLRTTNFALFSLGTVLSLAFGAIFFRAGQMSLGTVFVLYAYVQMLMRPVERLILDAQELQRAMAGVQRILELTQTRSLLPDTGTACLPTGPSDVAFDRVVFAYPKRAGSPNSPSNETPAAPATPAVQTDGEPVLRDVSFRLQAGKMLGLLGRTGSGKTTLTRLLLQLYDTSSGSVRIGGVDVRDVPLDDLMQHATVVTQDVQLFNASVRDNLTLFDPRISDAQLIAALDALQLADWLKSLPNGLDTLLTTGGVSAGQAQLLACGRAFLRNPGLVILDEASSRLDPATEQFVSRAMSTLLAGRTAIVIAHRLNTVEHADDILILRDGEVAEHGPRETLASDPQSMYAQLRRHGLQEVLA